MAGWYRQGTVALTPGSAAVAGAGTMWMGVVRPGSAFTTDGRTLYEIRDVANDRTLTLDRPWEGETTAASAYAVIAASATLSNAELAGEIAAMVAKWAVREDQYDDWLGGSPNGGPNADGKYPLTDSKGVTRLVESPARLLQLLDDGVVEHAAQIIAAIEDDVATARQAAADATAAMTAVGADRQAVAQAAATVAAQTDESTAAAATATAQAAIAVHHADEAANSATAAAGLEASATAALAAVETARDIVLEARTEAGTAATGALSARTAAEAARDTATAARDAAQQARDASLTARTQAQDWAVKTDAPVSGSLKSALSYALDAASQATVATGKAMEASGSAAAAAASAAGLDTAATAAQAAAGDAATGAQTATVKAAAAALSADTARSAAQQAETAGSGSATARAAAEAARDSAATAMTAAQVAASQAGQSQTNAANSAQTAATAAADAISAKSDATAARDLAVAARTEAQAARDLSQAFAQGAVGYQPSPGVYSAFHWSEQAKGHAQTAATIVGGSNFGIVGDGASQRFAADNPGSLLNLVQAPGGKLTFNPGNRAVSFGFDATTAPVAASGNITAGTVQGALEEIDHRLSTLSQDSIANGGGSVRVTEDGAVEIVPVAGRTATYKGGELHTSATAYDKAQTDAAIAAMIAAGQAAGAARLTTPRTIALSGGATGTATAFDGTQNIAIPVTAVAASALTGTIDIARLPAGALERLYPVASDAERFALTTAQVQKGDTVQVGGTGGLMYLVVDDSNLGNAAGYRAYTAARASAVDWSGVENKPALLTSLASLDNAAGVLTQTGAGTGAKRAIGVANGTDIPDRAAADGRYAQLGANNVFSGAVSVQNSSSMEAVHVGNSAGTKFTFVGWNDVGAFGRIGAYGSSAWQNFAISEGGSLTAIGTTAMPTGGAKLNVATGIQVDNKDVWHTGNFAPASKLDAANPTITGTLTRTGGTAPAYYMTQDGMGRQHWYWNTAGSTSPTLSVGGEDAMDIGMSVSNDGVNGPNFWFRGAHGYGKSAGAAISWSNILLANMTSFQWMGNNVWHAGNLVPGNYAAVTSANTFNGKQTILGTGASLPANTGIASAVGNTAGFEIQSQGTGTPAGAAFMSFHRPGNYGVHVGLDTDNEFKIGGWSMGGVAHKVWHAGNLPVTVSGNAVDFKANPTVNGAPLVTSSGTNTVTKSAVTVLPAAGSLDVPAKSILAVYSQFVGQAFNVDYNTEAQYTQENAATGTDQVGGQFQLYSTAGGGGADAATKLLIHADGANGSTEIIDERGITPFGSHCGWFDGASAWKLSSGYKIAFGTGQNFTFEGMVYIGSSFTDKAILDICDSASYTVAQICLRNNAGAPVIKYYVTGSDRIQSANLSTDVWYQWAVVRNNGTTTLYVNGIAQGSWADSTNFPPGVLGIGMSAGNPGQYNFFGWQDQIRVSKVARYAVNFTPPTTAFITDTDTVHLFSFDDGHGGQVLKDRANSGHSVFLGNNSTVTNARAKFGVTALNGNAQVGTLKTHMDFAMGSDDFLFDCWAYPTAFNGGKFLSLEGTGYDPRLSLDANGLVKLALSNNNASYNVAADVSTGLSLTLNSWNHVALFRSGSTVYVAVNGTTYATSVGTASISFSGAKVNINRHDVTDNITMQGTIDAVRIERGRSLWAGNFTPPATVPTTTPYTLLLLNFDGVNGDKVTLDSSGSSYGTNAFGDTTTSNLQQVTLASTYTRGGHGTSAALSAVGSGPKMYFSAPTAGNPIYFGTNTKLCIEGWFYFASFGNAPQLFNISDNGGSLGNSLQVYAATDGTLRVNGWGQSTVVVSNPAMNAGAWHHVALVRDGLGWFIYVDGVKFGLVYGPNVNPVYANATYLLCIGSYWDNNSAIIQGAVDSFRITNGSPRYTANFTPATLVADDMTTLMWEFNGAVGQKWVKELSGNSAMIAANGNARIVKDGVWITPNFGNGNTVPQIGTGQAKFGTGSVYNGGSGYACQTVPNASWMSGSVDLTIEAWVRPENYSSPRIIAQKWGASDETWALYLDTNGWLKFRYKGTSFNSDLYAGGPQIIPLNTFTHVAVTISSAGTVAFFVNGTKFGYGGAGGGTAMRTDSSGSLMLLGSTNGGDYGIAGYVDELRLSTGIRWTASFTPPTIPYGSSYVTGPFYVATLDSSRIDVSDWSTIRSATIAQTTPPGTGIKWLVSFDGRATWRKWDGSAWVVVPLNSGSSIDTNGNDYLTLQNALTNLNVESYSTIDFAFSLKTANPSFSPSVDAVTLARDEYELGAARIDYTIKRNGAAGAEIHRITNLKPYPVNVVYDYVA
ncbi:hypothetical protein GBZ48_28815 [Azospirillum melinis]|uniref:Uncharacterized protein n=1 Tax=Azospirillum melinis TaxID=328839 RepID=A0ABX2KKG1_9PROT|nr:LamG-like jellyroll fold domain-containing protein [Azospirillum melinis]MBP2307402.1 hypothetical protein [Azospirillum melinis]NUB03231.1 hypothetical protein [Azospirillum melinis]